MTLRLALPDAGVASAASGGGLHHGSDEVKGDLGVHGEAIRAPLQELLEARPKHDVLVGGCFTFIRCCASSWGPLR